MWIIWPRAKLGVKLRSDKKWMISKFNDLHQIRRRTAAADDQSCFFELGQKFIVHCNSMSMALKKFMFLINVEGFGVGIDNAIMIAEAHGSTFFLHMDLRLNHVNNLGA